MTTLQITLTIDQAAAMTRMLDLATRIHMAQFGEIEQLARFGSIKRRDGLEASPDDRDTLGDALRVITGLFGFSGLGHSHGIGSPHVSTDAHRAYELKKVVEKALAMHRDPNPQGIRGVQYDGLIVRYTADPVPVAEIKE
jgi:hypothetical protein